MRIITIIVKEINNGEDATVNVQHSHDGKQSEVEFVTVQMLNEFLFTKVGEVAKSKAKINPNDSKVKNGEVLN